MHLIVLLPLITVLAQAATPTLSVGLGIGLPTGIRRDLESTPGVRDGFNLRPRFLPSVTLQQELGNGHSLRLREEGLWTPSERHSAQGQDSYRRLLGLRFGAEYVYHPGKRPVGFNLFIGSGAQATLALASTARDSRRLLSFSEMVSAGMGWDLAPGSGLALRCSYGRFKGESIQPIWKGTSKELTTSLEFRLRVY